MKRLILISFLAVIAMTDAFQASAQYNDIYRKGTKLFSSEGIQLTPEEVSVLFSSDEGLSYSDWEKYCTCFKAGKGLLIASGSLTGAGLLTLGIGAVGLMVEGISIGVGVGLLAPVMAISGETPEITYDSRFRGVAIAGLVMSGTGILGLATGTAVYCVYKKRLDNMVDAYNGTAEASLSFGLQRNGVGFALDF